MKAGTQAARVMSGPLIHLAVLAALLAASSCDLFRVKKPTVMSQRQLSNSGRLSSINDTLLFVCGSGHYDIINTRFPDSVFWQDSGRSAYQVLSAEFRGLTGFLRIGWNPDTIVALDISGGVPGQYSVLGKLALPMQGYNAMALDDEHLCLAALDSAYIVETGGDPADLRLVGSCYLPDVQGYLGLGPAGPIAVNGKWMVVQWCAYWAGAGDSFWVSAFDISNPQTPVRRGTWSSGTRAMMAGDLAIVGDICYSADGLGLRSYDLAHSGGPVQLDSCDVNWEWRGRRSPPGTGYARATQLAIAGKYACISCTNPGNAVIDISNPRKLKFVFPGLLDDGGLALGVGCCANSRYYFVSTQDKGFLTCFALP